MLTSLDGIGKWAVVGCNGRPAWLPYSYIWLLFIIRLVLSVCQFELVTKINYVLQFSFNVFYCTHVLFSETVAVMSCITLCAFVTASVHFPRIGYNTVGFNWYGTERLIRKYFTAKHIPTYVYPLPNMGITLKDVTLLPCAVDSWSPSDCLHCFLSVVTSLGSASFIPVTSCISSIHFLLGRPFLLLPSPCASIIPFSNPSDRITCSKNPNFLLRLFVVAFLLLFQSPCVHFH